MNRKALLITLSVVILLLSTFSFGAIPAEERAALIALYNATNGDNWQNNSGWKTPPLHTDGFAIPGTEESWHGITLSGDNVDYIQISNNNVTGNIPPELVNLKYLRTLNMSDNHLSGDLPSFLGDLNNLLSLYLQYNDLTGEIPPELGNISNLRILYLYGNQLSGSIPLALTTLNNLIYLRLDNNQLTGSIPPELEKLSNLFVLTLHRNKFTGSIPQELGNLSKLQKLFLCYNQLSGSIPSELGSLNDLRDLWLNDTLLTGSIPPELGNLSNLEYLHLEFSQLSGSIPPQLGNLSKLRGLYLDSNQLTGSIPPEIGNLINLQYLYLSSNQLSGSIPSTLGNLINLQYFYMDLNQLTGSIPPELGNLSSAIHLNISNNQLNDSIPPELGNLNKLRYLGLYSNQLIGCIPPEMGNLGELYHLWLHGNQLSGSIPTELGNLYNLHTLNLNDNQLSGEIPKSLIYLAKLYSMSIRYNCLYTNDTELKVWLNRVAGDWEKYQTNCPASKITITSPNSGEIWTADSNYNITWISEGDVGDVKIEYTINGGNNWSTIIPSIPNDGIFSWNVPESPSSNCKIRVSEASDGEPFDESDSTFTIVPAPRILIVKSTPVTEVPINISPADQNGQGSGNTNFIRTYEYGTAVTLTAPSFSYGRSFLKWKIDNVDNESQVIDITMNNDHTVIAVYEEEATFYALSVQSTHGQGAAITVTPSDTNGSGDGITHFERTYYKGTIVTLTAPSTHHQNGKVFSHWKIDGKNQIKSLSVQITMDGDHKAKAYYRNAKSNGKK